MFQEGVPGQGSRRRGLLEPSREAGMSTQASGAEAACPHSLSVLSAEGKVALPGLDAEDEGGPGCLLFTLETHLFSLDLGHLIQGRAPSGRTTAGGSCVGWPACCLWGSVPGPALSQGTLTPVRLAGWFPEVPPLQRGRGDKGGAPPCSLKVQW